MHLHMIRVASFFKMLVLRVHEVAAVDAAVDRSRPSLSSPNDVGLVLVGDRFVCAVRKVLIADDSQILHVHTA